MMRIKNKFFSGQAYAIKEEDVGLRQTMNDNLEEVLEEEEDEN